MLEKLSFDEVKFAIDKILSNAEALIEEAGILIDMGRVPRCFTLSHLAREELSKIPMLYRIGIKLLIGEDVDWKNFWKRFRDHKAKLKLDALSNFISSDIPKDSEPKQWLKALLGTVSAKNDRKNYSLYVSFVNNTFVEPKDVISDRLARISLELAHFSLRDACKTSENLKLLAERNIEELREIFEGLDASLKSKDQSDVAILLQQLQSSLILAIETKEFEGKE